MTISKMVIEMVRDFYKDNEMLQTKYYLRGRSYKKEKVQKAYDEYKVAKTSEEKRIILQKINLAK